jgi:hypothetical protein
MDELLIEQVAYGEEAGNTHAGERFYLDHHKREALIKSKGAQLEALELVHQRAEAGGDSSVSFSLHHAPSKPFEHQQRRIEPATLLVKDELERKYDAREDRRCSSTSLPVRGVGRASRADQAGYILSVTRALEFMVSRNVVTNLQEKLGLA